MQPWLCRHYITGSTQTRPCKVCFHGNRCVAVARVRMTWSEVTAWLDESTAANLQLLYTDRTCHSRSKHFIFLLHLLLKPRSGKQLNPNTKHPLSSIDRTSGPGRLHLWHKAAVMRPNPATNQLLAISVVKGACWVIWGFWHPSIQKETSSVTQSLHFDHTRFVRTGPSTVWIKLRK